MKRRVIMLVCITLAISVSSSKAGLWDRLKEIKEEFAPPSKESPDKGMIVSALKEALSRGTEKAVSSAAKVDGYFGSKAIKILMPENIVEAADTLRKFGFHKQVDDFVLSMNRAAELAAPKAKPFFVEAIREMSFADAQKIVKGNETAATDYFREKMYDKLYGAFKPSVASSMNDVGVTRLYKNLMERYSRIFLMKAESLDLDHYVTEKSLDGLFYMVGQEEKRIRTDPAARVTALLRKVFGSN